MVAEGMFKADDFQAGFERIPVSLFPGGGDNIFPVPAVAAVRL